MKKFRKTIGFIAAVVFWLAVWEALSLFINREILLPSPYKVIKRLTELLCEKDYYISVSSSLIRVLLGFAGGAVIGYILGFAAFFIHPARVLLDPLLTVIRATPVASFIILALVWIGKTLVPSFTAFLMVTPIVYSGVIRGLESTDKQLYEVTKVFHLGFAAKLTVLYVPSSLPLFISSCKTALGMAWKAGIAAEVLCSLKNSIGGNVYTSKLYLESVDLMAWTLTVIILSLLLEKLLSFSLGGISEKYTVTEISGGKNNVA